MNKRTLPSREQLEEELNRERHKRNYRQAMRGTIFSLLTVAAIAVLIATLWLPLLQVTGTSMEPTLKTGEMVVALKKADFKQGDIVAFYYNNKILLKRVVGTGGEWIDIKEDGTVYVNDQPLDETYLAEKSQGESDLKYPYQVPDGRIFVLGDHRATSVDSRAAAIGCISEDLIVGKVKFRIWPFKRIGKIK